MRSILILGVLLALVAGCGSKGPLVMPSPNPAAGTAAPAPADNSSKPAQPKP
jgi:predicted small lipoprotein YifL